MDVLREAARLDARGPALRAPGGVVWSWGELDARVDAAALRLVEAGVSMGDGVATLLAPGPEAVVLLHAVPRTGAVLVPLHAGWTGAEVEGALRAAGGPRWLLAPGARVAALRAALPRTGTVAVEEIAPVEGADPLGAGAAAGYAIRPALGDPTLDTPVALLLTSGSTGRPRPVPITLGNLMASATGAAERLRLDAMDRWLAVLSPAHVGGLALLHRAAVVGCAVETRPAFDAGEFLELAGAGRITHASLVPTMLHRLLEAHGDGPAPGALRCVLVGGAHLPGLLLERALAGRWPVALTYGLTEATSQVATAPPIDVRRKPGSVGKPLTGVELRIADRGTDGVGEIMVRGATVAPLPVCGALEPRAAVPEVPTVHVDREGWLHTGDMGRLDAEGDLFVVGRISERIITGGVTVEPAEVERVLLAHPGVREAAVVGLPDPEWGETVAAAVTPADPAAPPDVEAVLAFVRERLSAAKRPRRLLVVERLPHSANGKVVRGEVARLFRAG